MQYKKVLIGILLVFCATVNTVLAQSGDQILDGIGETDLIARYILENNAKDWTRNNLHGSIQGAGCEFKTDKTFGKVLSLQGNNKVYISLPADWMKNQESLSISGWISMKSTKSNQVIFDFGKSGQNHFSAILIGNANSFSLQVQLTTNDNVYSNLAPIQSINNWNHFAIVLNRPAKTLGSYINGKLINEVENIESELSQIFSKNITENKIYIGKSINNDQATLNAKLHDFRIYRIPLSNEQINRIKNHSKQISEASVPVRQKQKSDLPVYTESTPQLYNAYLNSVPDVQVQTAIGVLPRLPRYLKGNYSDNISGPDVRVLWPTPKDNSKVLRSGTYKIKGDIPGTNLHPTAFVTVTESNDTETPTQTLETFALDQVSLDKDLNGDKTKFIENRDKFIAGLAHTNPDDFLYMFRNAFGQKQPEGAKPLGVWDSQETKLRGHATGHYLSATAQAYASITYDPSLQNAFADKMEYMVNVLYDLSQMSGQPKKPGTDFVSEPTAVPPGPGKTTYNSDLSTDGIRTDYWNWGKGFISAYPPDQFIMLESGAKYGTDNTRIWAPYYTLHKILSGLMDIYEISGNKKALEIVKGMGNWVHARLSKLPAETLISMWNSYIAGEFGGMNDAMARLYRLTNENRYLETAQLFDNIRVFFGNTEHIHGLAKNVDLFRGLHANQHIPQIMGALETYSASNAPEYYHIADNFWYKTTNDYMYSIGGVAGANNPANAECFIAEPATLYENGFSAGGQNETCATYNMLKLSRNLFLFNQQAELMDYYERGLYNHILASVAEDSPANTYHVPLRPGSVKHFGNPDMSGFTCCNGTALESSTKLQNSIYFKSTDNKGLYVNLFVPSTLNWVEKNITITQTTAFPKEDQTLITIGGNGKFDMHIRVPHWATNGFFVKINGKNKKVDAIPGSYLSISRKWKNGDTVELKIPFQFHLEPVMDQQNIASLFYGPILLAAQENEPLNAWRKITLNAEDIGKSISGDASLLQFNIDGVIFKPFYETYGRHSVYLDVTLKK